MTSPLSASTSPFAIDDKDLDDATLWALMDSATASLSSKPRKPPSTPVFFHSPELLKSTKTSKTSYHYSPRSDSKLLTDGEVLHEPRDCNNRPIKIARYCDSERSETSPMALVRSVQRTPVTTPVRAYLSPEVGRRGDGLVSYEEREKVEVTTHCLDRRFPSVSLFKEYQNAAMAILEKSDYIMLSGRPYIKKSGWRKISCYFNISYEIRDKTIEFDENRDVQRAEFVVRAHMQGGRFSDGWGSCGRREKRFSKPNHDIPSMAETRAKNKACQDLLGIGEYRASASLSS